LNIKYEIQMWIFSLASAIPGNIGCSIRRLLLPCEFGKRVKIWNGVQIDKPSLLKIKNDVSINRGTIIHAGGGVSIGCDVLIGPDVLIYSINHEFLGEGPIRTQGYKLKRVDIGDNVWIAAKVIILPGVSIGSGSVVAAGSVVTKDFPSGVLIAGNPAAIIKTL
jgi:maltose O-acetyltransferase